MPLGDKDIVSDASLPPMVSRVIYNADIPLRVYSTTCCNLHGLTYTCPSLGTTIKKISSVAQVWNESSSSSNTIGMYYKNNYTLLI